MTQDAEYVASCTHCGGVALGDVRCQHGVACNWCGLSHREYIDGGDA